MTGADGGGIVSLGSSVLLPVAAGTIARTAWNVA